METKKHAFIPPLLVALLMPFGAWSQTTAEAPPAADPAPAPPTVAERMQRSVAKQIESSTRMQMAIERQRSTMQQRAGQQATAGITFALPGPGHVAPTLTPPAPEPTAEDQAPEMENKAPEGGKEDIPPAGLIPFDPTALPKAIAPIEPKAINPTDPKAINPTDPKAIAPIQGAKPISSISPIPGTKLGGVSASAAQQLLDAMNPPGVTAQRTGVSPWMEELMRSLGGQGAAQSADLPQPPPDGSGNYSGRDSAPLTSFPLVNWLFGL